MEVRQYFPAVHREFSSWVQRLPAAYFLSCHRLDKLAAVDGVLWKRSSWTPGMHLILSSLSASRRFLWNAKKGKSDYLSEEDEDQKKSAFGNYCCWELSWSMRLETDEANQIFLPAVFDGVGLFVDSSPAVSVLESLDMIQAREASLS